MLLEFLQISVLRRIFKSTSSSMLLFSLGSWLVFFQGNGVLATSCGESLPPAGLSSSLVAGQCSTSNGQALVALGLLPSAAESSRAVLSCEYTCAAGFFKSEELLYCVNDTQTTLSHGTAFTWYGTCSRCSLDCPDKQYSPVGRTAGLDYCDGSTTYNDFSQGCVNCQPADYVAGVCKLECNRDECALLERAECRYGSQPRDDVCGDCLPGFVPTGYDSSSRYADYGGAVCEKDCSSAPDCVALNRAACDPLAMDSASNTCGGCLDGFEPDNDSLRVDSHSNSQCSFYMQVAWAEHTPAGAADANPASNACQEVSSCNSYYGYGTCIGYNQCSCRGKRAGKDCSQCIDGFWGSTCTNMCNCKGYPCTMDSGVCLVNLPANASSTPSASRSLSPSRTPSTSLSPSRSPSPQCSDLDVEELVDEAKLAQSYYRVKSGSCVAVPSSQPDLWPGSYLRIRCPPPSQGTLDPSTYSMSSVPLVETCSDASCQVCESLRVGETFPFCLGPYAALFTCSSCTNDILDGEEGGDDDSQADCGGPWCSKCYSQSDGRNRNPYYNDDDDGGGGGGGGATGWIVFILVCLCLCACGNEDTREYVLIRVK